MYLFFRKEKQKFQQPSPMHTVLLELNISYLENTSDIATFRLAQKNWPWPKLFLQIDRKHN